LDLDLLAVNDKETVFASPAVALLVLSSSAAFAGELSNSVLHDELHERQAGLTHQPPDAVLQCGDDLLERQVELELAIALLGVVTELLDRFLAVDLVWFLHSDSPCSKETFNPNLSQAQAESRCFLRVNGHPLLLTPDLRSYTMTVRPKNTTADRSMDTVSHSTSTLRYFLLGGRAHLEPLRIFESRRVKWLDHWVTFYALGTSHAILFEYGGGALTELLTCAPTAAQTHILEQGAVNSPWTVSRTFDNLSYRCRLTPFELGGRNRLQGSFASEDQITFKYHVDGEIEEPITHIGWRGGESALVVETIHTYPHEGQGVRSNSTFEISDGEDVH